MRIYDNIQHLTKSQIERRLQALDASAVANPYSVERDDKTLHHYVGVESSLTDAQIEACLGPIAAADTQAETAERERQAFLVQAKEAFLALKARVDKIESIAKAKGWNV